MPETEASVIREVTKLAQKVAVPVDTEKVHFAVIPADCTIKSLKDYQYPDGLKPDHITAAVRLQDAKSFIDYVTTFRDTRTRVFAGIKPMGFQAVLDYHLASEDGQAQFASHSATYTLALDPRWSTWITSNGIGMSQTDFAEFIEDNTADIFDPPAAAMLDVARDLHAHTDSTFASQIRLQDGQTQLKYSETTTSGVGTGSMAVPETFKIRVPVFNGEPPVVIDVRLRFRIGQGGKLTFVYKLYRQDTTLQHAFNAVAAGISEGLKMPVWIGDSGL